MILARWRLVPKTEVERVLHYHLDRDPQEGVSCYLINSPARASTGIVAYDRAH